MSLLPTILSGVTSLGGSLLANAANSRAIDKQNAANMQLAQYQNDRNYQLWKEQNEYNSPSSMMKRLSDAGLNPNLVYGSGQAVTTASSPAKTEVPHMEAYARNDYGFSQAAQAALSTAVNIQQLDNLKAAKAKLDADTNSVNVSTAGKVISNSRSEILRDIAQQTQEAVIDNINKQPALTNERTNATNIKFNLDNLEYIIREDLYRAGVPQATAKAKLDSIRTATANLQQTMDFNKFEQDMKRIGIYPGDALWERILGRAVEAIFGGDAIKKLLNPFKSK